MSLKFFVKEFKLTLLSYEVDRLGKTNRTSFRIILPLPWLKRTHKKKILKKYIIPSPANPKRNKYISRYLLQCFKYFFRYLFRRSRYLLIGYITALTFALSDDLFTSIIICIFVMYFVLSKKTSFLLKSAALLMVLALIFLFLGKINYTPLLLKAYDYGTLAERLSVYTLYLLSFCWLNEFYNMIKNKTMEEIMETPETINEESTSIIDERISPKPWQHCYLALRPILSHVTDFANLCKNHKVNSVLDLGCGSKPYESLFPFVKDYIGIDVEKNEFVDYQAMSWDLPFEDSKFDALVSTQVLEHVEKLPETIAEIRRVVKPDGLIFMSFPLAFPEHGKPYDYYRFTQYGIKYLFRDFEIVKISSGTGYIGTLVNLWNIFLSYIPLSNIFFAPIYLINNCIAIFVDNCFIISAKTNLKIFKIIYEQYYCSLTEDYMIVMRNKK